MTRQPFTTLAEMERAYLAKVLQHTGSSIAGQGGAAAILGLPASTLRHRRKKLGLKYPGKPQTAVAFIQVVR